MKLSPEQVAQIKRKLPLIPPGEKVELLFLIEEYERRQRIEAARKDFLSFILFINTEYKVGKHHKILAGLLQDIAEGSKDRIAVSMAPRFGKSMMLSEYFPAWFIGNNPTKKMIIASHTGDLAVDFGRKVRNLVMSDVYKEIFPDVELSADSKSAGRWTTNRGGEFFATGVGGALAGRGADLLVIDDPFSEQDVLAGNYEIFDKVYEWYAYGARTRLMPGGRVVVLHTRWMPNDLIGRLLSEQTRDPFSDQWEYVEFPAILNENTDNEKSLWPEQWKVEALQRTRAVMPVFQWNAQYQQQPTNQDGAIVSRDWFKTWTEEKPPEVEYTIMSLDAAQEKNKRADFSAFTIWGVFYRNNNYGEQEANIILLNVINKRVDFPELKDISLKLYREWKPDTFLVEKKSNGSALFQELRRTGMPVTEFTPGKGTDKIARLNAVADIVRAGLVWVPQYRWAEELVEQVNAFPATPHDDMVDSMTAALYRFRTGGFIRLPSDDGENDRGDFRPIKADYYRV
jgi:predicted phage terminase large subunit-like protein